MVQLPVKKKKIGPIGPFWMNVIKGTGWKGSSSHVPREFVVFRWKKKKENQYILFQRVQINLPSLHKIFWIDKFWQTKTHCDWFWNATQCGALFMGTTENFLSPGSVSLAASTTQSLQWDYCLYCRKVILSEITVPWKLIIFTLCRQDTSDEEHIAY